MARFLKRWVWLIILFFGLIAYFYFDLSRYLSFTALKHNHALFLAWTHQHYLLAVAAFMLIYIMAVAASIPGAIFLTLVGGFLFGIVWGTLYVVISATIGALCLFLAVRTALEPWIAKKAGPWVTKMRAGFQAHALQYLLMLRLIPIFPFWAVNIVPALLGVNTATFIFATFIGIMPGSFVYVTLGSGLGQLFDQNKTPDLSIIFTPKIFYPLIALGLLACLPSIYQFVKRKFYHG
jgi:uncharacterized membrane protein YdjX (TVP38/TMEM64 family)